jgi:hypothetical protein
MKKRMGLIIKEMIDLALERGYKPTRIKITQKDMDRLVEENNLYTEPGYEVSETHVWYNETRKPNYPGMLFDLPIVIWDNTAIEFAKPIDKLTVDIGKLTSDQFGGY